MLKRTTIIYTCMLVLLFACKKDDSSKLPVNYNATFTVDRINYYIGERVDFKTDGVNTTNYLVDYGDGQQSVTSSHIYQTGGVYTVSLLIEGKSVFSKK
ncbi:PKD domain-containing protein [Mucilaginibacter sp.]|uniref:PKD domain-containing protein n=1 Tax=Mucilaginibacter sp. TaxID=1882438 RepID=UPI003264323F